MLGTGGRGGSDGWVVGARMCGIRRASGAHGKAHHARGLLGAASTVVERRQRATYTASAAALLGLLLGSRVSEVPDRRGRLRLQLPERTPPDPALLRPSPLPPPSPLSLDAPEPGRERRPEPAPECGDVERLGVSVSARIPARSSRNLIAATSRYSRASRVGWTNGSSAATASPPSCWPAKASSLARSSAILESTYWIAVLI